MFIARVVGNVWATRKVIQLERKRLLLVQPLGEILEPTGKILMAVSDWVDAGPGDHVLVLDEGNSARQILNQPKGPIRSIIVGILDQVSIGTTTYHLH